jgi:hypothetical protein
MASSVGLHSSGGGLRSLVLQASQRAARDRTTNARCPRASDSIQEGEEEVEQTFHRSPTSQAPAGRGSNEFAMARDHAVPAPYENDDGSAHSSGSEGDAKEAPPQPVIEANNSTFNDPDSLGEMPAMGRRQSMFGRGGDRRGSEVNLGKERRRSSVVR